ncbi:phage tail protein [Escherichia coli]|uniref:phage tail protein n=1 Tax=Escherichia coli TaxID=562 RepID=UPI001861D5E5|nr:phage tail protein [Escherichia coli]QMQ76423.1 phage tail protein [Escherichia coli]WHF77803.1 phage tail protein [Escherichia coli]WHG02464.1 phage tail protein [Escherichia coli]WHG07338.1 phage tail protein [Escherichia coli]WHG36651.1 phage tail protein [Escherichia coli]
MMLALGMFVFMRQTLPHQTMQRESDYRWPSNSRIGKRDAFQFLGVGEENITLSLTRVDESLAALYGDIGKQAESLIGKAGSMATKFTGMTGAG